MVAITVILAAVIGAFVFGMGTPEKTPAANIVITAADASDDDITLEHRGGDSLAMDDVKILVKSGSTTVTIDPAGDGTGKAFSAGKEGTLNCSATTDAASWGGDADGTIDLVENNMIEVEFWYNPTGQRIAVISKAIKA